LSAPLLLSTLVIGLVISIFQALTQINENTLTFVPKMIVIAIILVLAGPWMLDVMSSYTVNLFESIATIVREP
jgi:flagellar biosynthesis protein FliQ